MNKIKSINLDDKFSLFDEKWTPKIIAELNNQYVKLCKLEGNFFSGTLTKNEDELFLVLKGSSFYRFSASKTVSKRGRNSYCP